MSPIVIVYAAVNVLVFALYGIDKFKAVRGDWRISERTLMLAAVPGVFGALLGMLAFRHKIRKPLFYIGVPLILVVEIVAYVLVSGAV